MFNKTLFFTNSSSKNNHHQTITCNKNDAGYSHAHLSPCAHLCKVHCLPRKFPNIPVGARGGPPPPWAIKGHIVLARGSLAGSLTPSARKQRTSRVFAKRATSPPRARSLSALFSPLRYRPRIFFLDPRARIFRVTSRRA